MCLLRLRASWSLPGRGLILRLFRRIRPRPGAFQEAFTRRRHICLSPSDVAPALRWHARLPSRSRRCVALLEGGDQPLDHLGLPGVTPLPAFDKASDERRPQSAWREVEGPLDVVILEGWCMGARPQPRAELVNPVNSLERAEDADGVWRRYVDRQLAQPYQALFERLDMLVLLAAPGFDVVRAWRTEQEHKLRARTPGGMDDNAIAHFVAHYERLTRWILEEMPSRADWTISLAADRTPGV